MKQTIVMIVLTLIGTFGAFVTPFWGVAVYYFFAVLRPQYIWEWALPSEVRWSMFVAVGTLVAARAAAPVLPARGHGPSGGRT